VFLGGIGTFAFWLAHLLWKMAKTLIPPSFLSEKWVENPVPSSKLRTGPFKRALINL
jgi:hypothetical protein